MTTELIIVIAGILGLIVGLQINKTGIKERDARISELEKELTVKQNVADSLNATVQRLRKKLDKKNGGKTDA